MPNFLFSWEDIKPAREKITNKKIQALALINNTKNIKDEYLEALTSKKADFILWNERNTSNNIHKLKAA